MAETAILAGLAITSAAAAAHQANVQNKAAKKSNESAQRATGVQLAQLRAAAQDAKARNFKNQQQVIGKLRVASADAGIGFGGSYSELQGQAEYDTAYNNEVIDLNTRANSARVASGLEATSLQLDAMRANPILQGFMGGLQGLQTGLAITSALELEEPEAPASNPSLSVGGRGGMPSYGGNRRIA